MMFEKRYTLIKIEIIPASTFTGVDGLEEAPRSICFSYQTEVIENGNVIARLPMHQGTAPADDTNRAVDISADGTTKTLGEILAEAGVSLDEIVIP